MTALIIILCVLAFLALLLFLPVTVRLFYNDLSFKFKVKYAGITVFKSDKEKPETEEESEETPTTEKPETKEVKKESFIKKEYKRLGAFGFIRFYGAVLKYALYKLVWFIKKLKFKVFLIDLTVATKQAADTAIQYGGVCAAVYPVLSLLVQNAEFKLKKVNISTDFDKTEYELSADISVTTRIVYMLILACAVVFKYFALKKESENDEREQ